MFKKRAEDESHNQAVSIDFVHAHQGVQPHRHVYLSHNKNDPGVSPTPDEAMLIKQIKKGVSFKMRINEYNSLEEFTHQYVGEWAPSKGHWFGLDFSYKGSEYRLHI